jgi:hypothetical protein
VRGQRSGRWQSYRGSGLRFGVLIGLWVSVTLQGHWRVPSGLRGHRGWFCGFLGSFEGSLGRYWESVERLRGCSRVLGVIRPQRSKVSLGVVVQRGFRGHG